MTTFNNLLRRTLWISSVGLIASGSTLAIAQQAESSASQQTTTYAIRGDRIVAVVNTDVITRAELDNRERQVRLNLKDQNVEIPPENELRRQILERLIIEKTVQQRAREVGIRVDEQIVSAAIEQIARENKITVNELRQRLQNDNVSFSAFRHQIRDEITLQRLREREVDSQINIPESEVDAFLAEKAGFTAGDTQEYLVQHIALPVTDEANQRQVQRQAEDIIKQVRDGADFKTLARQYSAASNAQEGGQLDWRDSSRLPSSFWQAIESHRNDIGYMTTVNLPGSIHIVRLADIRDGVQARLAGEPINQAHVRHILMYVSDLTPEAEVVARLNNIKHSIESGQNDFATLARLASVDASATRGGDIGWISPGDTAPEFESAINALEEGQISAPFKTQFGYHLVQLIERRTAPADAARSRAQARQQLRMNKLGEAVNVWQRELRDRAYVEIRDESLL